MATGWHVGHMPTVAVHVISHSVHISHDRWFFVLGGGRDAVLLCYNTGRTYEARLPNTFQPHTFLISLVRTAKSQLWPMRRWVGDALSNP